LGDINLDCASRQFGVFRAFGTPPDLAVNPHDPLGAERFGNLEGRAVGIGDHLGQAVVVALVDEQQPTVVADAMAPAGQPDILADVAVAERATSVGTITLHAWKSAQNRMNCPLKAADQAHAGCFLSRQPAALPDRPRPRRGSPLRPGPD